MAEPNTCDRNSHGSRVHEISDRKIAARFFGRLPTTRCGEEDRRLLRFSNGLWFLRSRSITHADRDGGRKLARSVRYGTATTIFRIPTPTPSQRNTSGRAGWKRLGPVATMRRDRSGGGFPNAGYEPHPS